MLRKRLIFTLIYEDGMFCQSRNFFKQRVGDVDWLFKNYDFERISNSFDELIIVNASDEKKIDDFSNDCVPIIENLLLPVCLGGGIGTLKDSEILFKKGADKILLCSNLNDEKLIRELNANFGAQSIVGQIDYIKKDSSFIPYIKNGKSPVDDSLSNYINRLNFELFGEIIFNSIDLDGTGFGYDQDIVGYVRNMFNIPIILSGGAGKAEHFQYAFSQPEVSAASTANLFNFMGDALPKARSSLLAKSFNLAEWRD